MYTGRKLCGKSLSSASKPDSAIWLTMADELAMRVCVHIVKNAQPECTGIARIIADLGMRSRAYGYETAVLFLGDGPLMEMMRKAGIAATVAPWAADRKDPGGAWRVWRELRKSRPAIAHLHHGGRLPRIICRLAGAQAVVQHVHGQMNESQLSPTSQRNFRGVDATIACSAAAAANLHSRNTEVIYAGIDVADEPPAPAALAGPLRIGVLARLVPLKRIDALIEAVAHLAGAGTCIELEIAGTGPSEASLRELAQRLGVGAQVRFLGWREDSAPLLASWHGLAMPSLDEGFPVAALEAMAAGRAVLASRVGGLCEQVVDGVTGRLFEPGDTAALLQILAETNQDRARLARMGYEGWRRVKERFSADAMTRRTTALYDRLLQRADARAK